MEKMKVRELMVSVDQFSRISDQATFMEAVTALEKADQAYSAGKVPGRIVLVEDASGKIIGKLSPMDVVLGLEPNYFNIEALKDAPRVHLAPDLIESMKETYRLWQRPFGELCKKAYNVKVRDFIKPPEPDHLVDVDDRMDTAFHKFVVRRHGSLFVKEGKEIVGLIRFADVYEKIKETISSCPMPG